MKKPVHVLIARICAHSSDWFTSSELAHLFEVNQWTICDAIRSGRMEGSSFNFKGNGTYNRYRVEKAQVIAWIWKNTTGNRETLRESLRVLAPGMLEFLDSLPSTTPGALAVNQAPRQTRSGAATAQTRPTDEPELFTLTP